MTQTKEQKLVKPTLNRDQVVELWNAGVKARVIAEQFGATVPQVEYAIEVARRDVFRPVRWGAYQKPEAMPPLYALLAEDQ